MRFAHLTLNSRPSLSPVPLDEDDDDDDNDDDSRPSLSSVTVVEVAGNPVSCHCSSAWLAVPGCR